MMKTEHSFLLSLPPLLGDHILTYTKNSMVRENHCPKLTPIMHILRPIYDVNKKIILYTKSLNLLWFKVNSYWKYYTSWNTPEAHALYKTNHTNISRLLYIPEYKSIGLLYFLLVNIVSGRWYHIKWAFYSNIIFCGVVFLIRKYLWITNPILMCFWF